VPAQAVGEGLAVLAADVAGLRGGRLFLGEGGGVAMPPPFFCDAVFVFVMLCLFMRGVRDGPVAFE
jgi:hypothetical protein